MSESGIQANRGSRVRERKYRLADWLQVSPSRVVVSSSATVALTVAIGLSTAKSSDVPALSFPATAHARRELGKQILFGDTNPDTRFAVDRRDYPDTGLVNVIPFGGSFGDAPRLDQREIVIDAVVSLSSQPCGLDGLSGSTAVVFSMHATKPSAEQTAVLRSSAPIGEPNRLLRGLNLKSLELGKVTWLVQTARG